MGNKEKLDREMIVASNKYSALMRLFDAAAAEGNAKDMEEIREKLHGLLDLMLDQNASIYSLYWTK